MARNTEPLKMYMNFRMQIGHINLQILSETLFRSCKFRITNMATVPNFEVVKRPGREADHSPPSSTEVRNA